jgi:hypothetical protein
MKILKTFKFHLQKQFWILLEVFPLEGPFHRRWLFSNLRAES